MILNNSANGKEIQTSSTPQKYGNITRGIIRNTRVLNREIIADVLPSLRAVKNPDAK